MARGQQRQHFYTRPLTLGEQVVRDVAACILDPRSPSVPAPKDQQPQPVSTQVQLLEWQHAGLQHAGLGAPSYSGGRGCRLGMRCAATHRLPHCHPSASTADTTCPCLSPALRCAPCGATHLAADLGCCHQRLSAPARLHQRGQVLPVALRLVIRLAAVGCGSDVLEEPPQLAAHAARPAGRGAGQLARVWGRRQAAGGKQRRRLRSGGSGTTWGAADD